MLSTPSHPQQCDVVVTGAELPATPAPVESGRGLVLPTIEAYQGQHLPSVKASADTIGVVEGSNQVVPTEMGSDPGTIVRGMILDPLRGRSPLSRLEEFFAHQDTARLVGQALAPAACHEDPVGRVLDRLYDVGTMKSFTAWAVRADPAYGWDQQAGHFDPTSIRVQGDDLPPAGQLDQQAPAVPLTMTHGSSKDKRPALQPCVFSTVCGDRAGPRWGKPEDGQAADTPIHNPRLATIAPFLGPQGGAPGASIQVAEAALVTEDNLAALGDPLCITRFPAPDSACGRLIAEAVAPHAWGAVGVLAHTQPTTQRPATSYRVSEGAGTLDGTAQRAVVVHASAPDNRRQQRWARDLQAAYRTRPATVRTAEPQEDCCRADADAAAGPLRAVHTPAPLGDVTVAARPGQGRGRPSAQKPRPLTATRDRRATTMRPHTERLGRMEEEAGCFILLTNGPTAGALAHGARERRTVYQEPQGTEQTQGCLTAPVLVNRLFLKKPARLAAVGVGWLLSLRRWRLMERALRRHGDTTRTSLPGWDQQVTERPTAFMRVPKFAGVIGLTCGHDRPLAHPLAAVQHPQLPAREVPATWFTLPTGEQRTAMAGQRLSRRHKRILQW